MTDNTDLLTRNLARLLAQKGHLRLAVKTILFNAKTKSWEIKMDNLERKRQKLVSELEDIHAQHIAVLKN